LVVGGGFQARDHTPLALIRRAAAHPAAAGTRNLARC
jgi:hypothetical protein